MITHNCMDMLTLLFACFSESYTTSKWSVLMDWSCINRVVLHDCGIMSMSGSSNNQRIEASLGECIGEVLMWCALLLLFEHFGFLAATIVSPMMPASMINAVIPSLSREEFESLSCFCHLQFQ